MRTVWSLLKRKAPLCVPSSSSQQQQLLQPARVRCAAGAGVQGLAALHAVSAALEPCFPASTFLLPSQGAGGKEGLCCQDRCDPGLQQPGCRASHSLWQFWEPLGVPPAPRGNSGGSQDFCPFFSAGVCQRECGYLSGSVFGWLWGILDVSNWTVYLHLKKLIFKKQQENR